MTDDIKCPACGSKASLRTAKKGPNIGKRFIVCERYPECKFKVRYVEAKTDIGTHNKLALAMWRMGIQPRKNGNTYAMLVFDPKSSFSLQMIELEPKIVTAKDAACYLFPFVTPWVLAIPQPPKPALREVLHQLNPRDFLNPKMLPMAAIKPSRRDSILCICLELQEGTTRIGLVLDDERTAVASTSEVSFRSICSLYTHVCEAFINEKSQARTNYEALMRLADLINSMKLNPEKS